MDFGYDRPYGTFEAGDGDGYDLYSIHNGWVSVGGTRDGGGYSQTFWGSGCTDYNGWVFFPTSFRAQMDRRINRSAATIGRRTRKIGRARAMCFRVSIIRP